MTNEEKDAEMLRKEYTLKIDENGYGRCKTVYHAAQCVSTWSALNCQARIPSINALWHLRTLRLPYLKTPVARYRKEGDTWVSIAYSYTNAFIQMAMAITDRMGIKVRGQA